MSKIRTQKNTKDNTRILSRQKEKAVVFDVERELQNNSLTLTLSKLPVLNHLIAFFLITSFFMQGVVSVSANTDGVETASVESSETSGETEEVTREAGSDDFVDSEELPNADDTTVLDPSEPELEPEPEPEPVVIDPLESEESPEEEGSEAEPAPETSEPESGTETSENQTENESGSANGTSTEVTANEEIEELLPEAEGEEQFVSVTYSDAEVVFNKQSCTELASGSFYCQEAPVESGLSDTLFASPDEDGDLEIYLLRDGEQFKVTDNLVDDAAPFYDQNSNTLVWHRLIDDRYQIVVYDIESGTEEQITHTGTNNMEPTRQGEYIVWQRWVESNWDVVLYSGTEETVISKSDAHDIAPYVHGSLVVWNRYSEQGEKTIEMYDIANDTYVTVNDPEGMSVTNPRMVFVYDSLHPNGDIVTKGYDVLARKFIDLSTLPRPLPEELPHSDSTGETRALIQNKPAVKSEVEEVLTEPEISGEPPRTPEPMGSSTDLTLDLSGGQGTESEPVLISTIPEVQVGASVYDLVIPPLQSEAVQSETDTQ